MRKRELKKAIRDRQAATGEKYSTARREVLAALGLPPETPTSRNAEKRREAAIVAEYGEHLGIDIRPPPPTRWAPQPKGPRPVVEERFVGRVYQRGDEDVPLPEPE